MGTLKDCLYRTIHRNEKPLKLIAELLDVSESYLARAALPDQEESETGTGCRFPLKKLIPLIEVTGDFQVLDFIERSLGRVAINAPKSVNSLSDMCRLSLRSVKEFGELMSNVEVSLSDGRITPEEKERIGMEGYQAIQAIVALMQAIEKK